MPNGIDLGPSMFVKWHRKEEGISRHVEVDETVKFSVISATLVLKTDETLL